MSEEKNIPYSAADIERYHKRLMTPQEMNAMEKAALDDPFLADAIEGYSTVTVNIQDDIALLNKKLGERTSERKVIPLTTSNFPWLRVAALFVVLIGAGLIAYRYILPNEKNQVAITIKSDSAQNKTGNTDTNQQQNVPAENKSAKLLPENHDEPEKNNVAIVPGKRKKIINSDTIIQESRGVNDVAVAPVQSEPAPIKSEEEVGKRQGDLYKETNSITSKKANAKLKIQKDADSVSDTKDARNRAEAAYNFSQNDKTNIFRGQVLDANNSPLPFSNVTIIPDNIGTYSDAKGYFTLISPDSTLNVRVRSVGFENSNALLQNKLSNNAIILQQDIKNIPSTVINSRKINTERKQRGDNITPEEPEPADGWYNYDTYIANNIQITDEIKTKTTPASEVELSFDVNKLGEPINIKVEKSVCKECDQEAVRLLKDGPKWKWKKKNHRAKVEISFQQQTR